MIMKHIVTVFSIIFSLSISSQEKPIDIKQIFWDAETYFYENDYKEALSNYLELNKIEQTDNANLFYRIGVCYLKGYNKKTEKIKAIPYLEKAVKSTSKDYEEGEITELNAAEDAFIYLGDAYAINNELDKAIQTYNQYKEESGTTDKYFLDIVNRKIETCESAKLLETLSIKYTLKNLGSTINNKFANYNAVMSADGNTIAYTSDMKFYEAVFYSNKVDGKFTEPKNLNIEAKVEGSIRTTGISSDGKELYLFKKGDDDGKGDIFVSKFDGTKWSGLERLNKNINSSDLEQSACPSSDGNTLYFTSNRKGGFGSLDIYKSIKQEDGQWGKAINLGEKINSNFDDVYPFILSDNKTMYFGTQGHYYNMGQNDLFMVKQLTDSTYTKPLNFGYPLNTTDDNSFIYPLIETGKALISLASDDGFGDLDIYEITFYPQTTPTVTLMGKLDNYGKEIEIKINSDNQNTQEIKTKTDGNFSIQTPSGKVTITITAENMDNASKTLDIPKVYCLAEINISDIELKHNNTEIAEKNGGHQKNTFETINNTTIPTILFEFNKINADKYNKDLDLLANYLNSANNILVEIGGYADAQGDEAYNLMLSEKRANTIKNYLISKSVNAEKLIVKAYGEKYPVSININPKSRKYNRRVQFKIIRDEIGKLNFALPVIPDEYMIK